MILKKLSTIKSSSENIIDNETNRIKTAISIEQLLKQIDFTSEIVPTNDSEKLKKLFTSLKGEKLTNSEHKLIEEITNEIAHSNL